MNRYKEKSLPKVVEKIIEERNVQDGDVGLLLSGISNSSRMKRATVTLLFESTHLWEKNGAKSPRALRSAFVEYLRRRGVDVSSSEITRILQASEIEKILGLPIGTCKEGVLRPLTVFLVKNKEQYIVDAWDEAMSMANKNKENSTEKEVKIKHVLKVLSGEKFQGVVKKRGRKPVVRNGDQVVDSLPIGNENMTKTRELLSRLIDVASKLKGKNIKSLIRVSAELLEKQGGCSVA